MRLPEEIEAGIRAAREAIAAGDAAVVAYLTGIPEEDIARVTGA